MEEIRRTKIKEAMKETLNVYEKLDLNMTEIEIVSRSQNVATKVAIAKKQLETEAAAILNVSPQFVRVAMQQGKLPIGTAVQMSSIWTYHISEKLLADYSGKNIEKEIERIRGGVEK